MFCTTTFCTFFWFWVFFIFGVQFMKCMIYQNKKWNKLGLSQGRIITGNLWTRFPGNLKVSHEIFIVNPVHLSRKYETSKTTQTFLSHKKNSSCDRKNTVGTHRIEYPLQEEEQILLQEVHLVSQEKYFLWQSKMQNHSCDRNYFLVIGETFPVTWKNVPMSQEKLPVTGKLPQKKYNICHKRIFPVNERIFLVTGN